MKNWLVLGIFILASSSARADDVEESFVICQQHLTPADGQGINHKTYRAGWEHCSIIAVEMSKRDQEIRRAAEANDPDLKRTRELSRKLLPGPLKP
jgi:hypothetical protein